ncbi:hypothetical protein [Cerasicoccus frondis]|uniref:hypothetical protein n=1 Tax=Cerasicoccus frondis TaxID=490090 RepID=UPI002852880D|nr:hypothetical protein [Cerasicoccus frondis]
MDNVEEFPDNLVSARQASWYFLQALEAADTLAQRQELINMLAEEIITLNIQIRQIMDAKVREAYLCISQTPPEQTALAREMLAWESPTLTAGEMSAALRVGYELAGHMQDLRNFIREYTNDSVWPRRVYRKESIWPEHYGNVQQQQLLPGMEKASGFSAFPPVKAGDLLRLQLIHGKRQ